MDITISPTQLREEIIEVISAGLVPYVKSSPGMGKSSIIADVAKRGKLKLIDLRLSQCTPEDLQGFPMRTGNKATFTPFDLFPLQGETPPEGYDGWLLLLDEMSSASKPVQAAAYKLVLDRMVGSFHLHENCATVCAGNKSTDRAVVVQMSTALQSRLVHYELALNSKEWIEWAMEQKVDHRITGFINFMPSKLMDFKPDHTDNTFACPRTWEFLNRLVKGREISNAILPRVAGTIGMGVAVEFIAFAKEFDRLPSLHLISTDPDSVSIPPEASTKYATISMLMEGHTVDNIENILKYMKRMDNEMQIVFARGVNTMSPKMRSTNKPFGDYIMGMLKSLK